MWSEYREEGGRTSEKSERRWRKGAKYRVYCPRCGWETDRKKRTKVVKRPDLYRCPECGSDIQAQRIEKGRPIK
ncbi:hypothetical protein AKJ38_04345 [candidate division MSBL1 archaeon SCGC-AAA259I14]|uniref:Uncharacterized protein n=1 Tax=candidate division MSBL1 archaeon SCGC-AAA259I14 TaxID=1698268 RepID=A0A133UNJ3_9EURY|nr:hypothetical protein AKJ38_04345 [candidate division MSBL1 archaeon SCGC-AAA259I14]